MWFGVLGAIEACADVPLRLSSRRQRALAGMLVCHRGSFISIDRLVEAIWEDDAEPQQGKAALQTIVSRLRTAISDAGGDPRVIVSDEAGYRLVVDAAQADAWEFEALIGEGAACLSAGASDLAADAFERALGLFRGAPYVEFAHCSWARAESTRLNERWADATELLATALLDRGAHRELVPRLEAAIVAHPYREGLQSALMTALYRCGRHADALRSYRAFRNTLGEDLGLEPSPELHEHEGRILRHDPALDAPLSGRPLRGYRLHDRLGSNHLGTVWRATQPGVGREVSVTIIDPSSLSAASWLTDFDATVRALGRLDHPNIAGVLDAWNDAGGAYLVTRLVHGPTLEMRCDDGPLAVKTAETLVQQVRSALDHAHGCDVGHGDLSASAVTIDADGNAVVTGWGVAATTDVFDADDEAVSSLAARLGVDRPVAGGFRPNPYRGLAAFHEAEAHWFFGRERVVEALVDAVAERRFMTIIGASGSGKSSVMKAGLAAALRAGALDELNGWEIVSLTPGVHSRQALATVVERCRSAAGGSSTSRGVVVLIDQFEELFTMTDASEREELIEGLAALVTDGGVPARIVATLRADHLDAPFSHATLGPLIGPSLFPIGPMTPSELHRAITLPAAAVGATVDDELAAELVADIGARPNALPLMQFTLTELFDGTGGDDLTLNSFRELGGLEGAIARRAEHVFGTLTEHARAAAHMVFANLASIEGDGTWVRRRVAVRQAVDGSDAARDVLDAFVAARLLAVEVDPISREPLVSMTHEALAREWPRLAGWMEGDREASADLRDLRSSIGPWVASGRDPDQLLRGAALARASAAAAARPDLMSTDERTFLDASTQQATATSRRARRFTVAVAILATVALVGAVLAFGQRQDARTSADAERQARTEADLGRLALQAQVLANGPTDLALLLAVESWRRAPGPASEAALLSALTAHPLVDRYVAADGPQQSPIQSLHLTAAGRLVVRRGTLIEMRDASTLQPISVAFEIGAVDTLTVRADGAEIATASEDGRVRRWDAATGRPIPGDLTVTAGTGPPIIAYTSDGRIAVVDPDGAVVVIDPTDGSSRAAPIGEPISLLVADPLSTNLIAASETATYLVSIGNENEDDTVEILTGLSSVRQMAFSRDGTRLFALASQAEAGTLFEIDAATLREPVRRAKGFVTLRDAYVPLRYPSGVLELEGSRVVVTGELGRAVVLDPTWRSSTVVDLGTGTLVARDDGTLVGSADRSLTVVRLDAHGVLGRPLGGGLVGAASSSADGERIAVQTGNGVVVAQPGAALTYPIDGSTASVATPYLSPDGKTVALRTMFRAEFVDVTTNRLLGDPITTVGAPASFSPDGSLVAVPGFVGVVILQLPSLAVIAAVPPREPGDLITDLAWSPDGQHLALTGLRGRSRVVDASTGADIATEMTLEVGSQLRWSADGSRIAVIVPGAPSRLIDASTGEMLRELPSVRGPIELAGWTRGDQRLVVVRAAEPDDAVAELIDTSTGQRIGPPIRIAALGSFVRGRGNVTANGVHAFPTGAAAVATTLDPDEWSRIACEVAGRNLTETEWRLYLQDLGPWRPTCPEHP